MGFLRIKLLEVGLLIESGRRLFEVFDMFCKVLFKKSDWQFILLLTVYEITDFLTPFLTLEIIVLKTNLFGGKRYFAAFWIILGY